MANSATTEPEVEYVLDMQSLAPKHATAIKAFWLCEGALDELATPDARLSQVVMHAQDATGAIVAVCTAEKTWIPKLKEWMYCYRSFVSGPWRKHGIAITLLQRSAQCLADYARENSFPCIGILIAVESQELREISSQPYWPRTQFTFAGIDPKQRKYFVRYFDGARLSS